MEFSYASILLRVHRVGPLNDETLTTAALFGSPPHGASSGCRGSQIRSQQQQHQQQQRRVWGTAESGAWAGGNEDKRHSRERDLRNTVQVGELR